MKCTKADKRAGKCDKGKFYSATKNTYNETSMWIDNNQPLYNNKWAFYKNYCRKMVKGKFDRNLAKKGFKILINRANQDYKKQMGESLPMDDRRVAENILVKDFYSDVRDEGGCEKIAGYKKK